MRKLVLLFVMMLGMIGCRSIRYVPIVEVRDSIITPPIDTVVLPPDSGVIKALLRCDEQGKVVMENLEAANGENIRMMMQIDSMGNLLAMARKDSSLHLKPQKPIIIEREKQVPFPVEKELSRWESVKMKVGGYAIVIGILALLIFIGKFALRIKK